MVLGIHFISVSVSAYVDNGTAKVPISEKLGLVSKDLPPKSGTSHLQAFFVYPFKVDKLLNNNQITEPLPTEMVNMNAIGKLFYTCCLYYLTSFIFSMIICIYLLSVFF